MFERMYSTIGSLFRATDEAAAERSAASESSKACSTFQIRQTFDFRDAAREDVLLALLLDGQQAGLDGVQRNGVDQVTQGDARLHLALKRTSTGFRHVQRHDAGGGSKGDQTGTGREGDADRETGVRVATGADGIRQQQAVQPGVDDAVARTQRNAAAVLMKDGSSRCILTSTSFG